MAAVGHSAWRVLVVDDEENLNWSLVNSLQKEGYITEGARTGEAALTRLADTSFDCVISDVKMPGMDGFELLQWLRQHRPHTRVIMMTAFGSPTARQEALRNGVIAYMEKPFDLRTLKEELRRLATSDTTSRAEEEGYDLLEVTRVLNLSRRDIAVSVQGGGYSGILRFLRGELIYAEAGPLRGEQAFLAICGPKGGQVQPMPWDGRTERNVTTPISRLIYMALSERDNHSAGASAVQSAASATGGDSVPISQIDTATAAIPTPPAAAADLEAQTRPAPAAEASPPSAGSPAFSAPVMHILDALAEAISSPCGLVVLRPEGSVLAQSWKQMPELSTGVYSHLAAAAQAASRALLLGDIGPMREVSIRASGHFLLVRRIAAADRAALLVAILPGATSEVDVSGAIEAHMPSLAEALR